jgi:hypothetical protein
MIESPGSVYTAKQTEIVPHRKPDVVWQPGGDEAMLYDLEADAIHVLTPAAMAVWELCDGQHTVKDIAHRIRSRLSGTGSGNIRQDIETTLQQLVNAGLVTCHGAGEAEDHGVD